jgi:hypothetical protein
MFRKEWFTPRYTNWRPALQTHVQMIVTLVVLFLVIAWSRKQPDFLLPELTKAVAVFCALNIFRIISLTNKIQ